MTTDLLSIDEAAKLLRMSYSTFYSLVRADKIRYVRLTAGGPYLFQREWLDEYYQSCIHEPAGEQSSANPQPTIVSITRSSRAKAVVEPQSQKERLKEFKQQHKKRGMA
jgi:excisionase family DNA binding protein